MPVSDEAFAPATPADLIQTLATMCGIGPDVAALLADRLLLPGPTLAELLIRRRRELGLTYRAMSARCGLATTQARRYEILSEVPGCATIFKLAKGYELPVVIILAASLNSANLIQASAPGAKPIPRNRTRLRKP